MRLRLARAALVALAAVAAAGAAATGCGLNQEGIGPPSDRIFYPGAIAVDPTGKYLYVVNSNADLRFNDGTLVAIELARVDKVREGARPKTGGAPAADADKDLCTDPKFINQVSGDGEYCCWDALDRNVLNCDERQFVVASAAVKIGSFGSALQVQTLDATGDHQRLLTAVRGNASVTWVDAKLDGTGISFSCTTGAEASGFVECDLAHRVSQTSTVRGTPTPLENPLLLPEEPYALAVDPAQELLYVGHLRGGFLSAVNLAGNPTLIGAFSQIFPGDINGSVGVTSLTLTAEGINNGRIYATSRYLPRAGSFAPISLGQIDDPSNNAVNNPEIFLGYAGDPFVSPLPGSEARGIQPIPAIHRTFLLQRTPPVLIGFDTTMGQSGQNLATDILEMCNGPTFLHMYPPFDPAGDSGLGKRLFVNCFEAGQVYVVDPYVPKLTAIIEVGRGPAGLAFNPKNPNLAYVVGFGSNNVSVVDLDPTSATRYHVIQRIGFPSPVPR